ncbi:isoprenylcysteine carboxylmethyltransferase family protein [Sulfitobacter sp. JBTF-M27]|uniref:Isoprenylcysteine carboxylmethyltransferase family protein n=1 Tax=Sulfitobacter sediminilitoris TaxID=2698830 RepID=A0A6P0C4I8_9RHOB|nr:isoprenylcysteine carboxylmethyltransferase family protein [Sulfitobacter sediminilitoris]NEK21071.1 isoprenylcysteine carboxylmethyltransferase family protein [Sulfitobacter sediminilitoris]
MAKWRETGNLTPFQMLDLPPVWLLGALLVAWAQVILLPGLTHPFAFFRWAGALLAGLGIALMIWAIAAFRRHETTVVPHQTPARIIVTGPFAHSRNPIYLGDVMVLTGAILWWGAWPSLLLIPVFVSILTRRFIAPEEARMKESFGTEFEAFAEKTPRWL